MSAEPSPPNPPIESFSNDRTSMMESREAADVLVRHLFAAQQIPIGGVEYAVDYRLAVGRSGGDIVDAFPLADGRVAIVVADIAGKGPQASVQAALVKFSLRAFASAGFSPAESLVRLDRLYAETTRFERSNSFVTVFAGQISPDRSKLVYASAGHDVVAARDPDGSTRLLDVTAGAIGVLPSFTAVDHERRLAPGSLLVLATDGVTEARRGDSFFGLDGFVAAVDRYAASSIDEVVRQICNEAVAFSDRDAHDDSAILALRIDLHDARESDSHSSR